MKLTRQTLTGNEFLSENPTARRNPIFLMMLCLLLGLFAVSHAVRAQDFVNGGFSGTVSDANNNPLANATVTFTNLDNGVPVSTRTDKNGAFVKNALQPGNYRIVILIAGFQTQTVEQKLLATKTNQVLPPFYLQAEITVAVVSPSPTPAITTSTPTPAVSPAPSSRSADLLTDEERGVLLETRRGGSFTENEVTALPLGNTTLVRSFDELALLVPGVAPPPQTSGNSVGPGVGPGVGTSGQFSVNGLRSRANNFTVDGSDNNDEDIGVRRQGFFSLIPQPVESVQEFQIITLLAPAQFGRNLGAQVNVLSKSGSNRFNGTLYTFFNSDRLNARNFFDYQGANTTLPLQGRRQNGSFANVEVRPANGTTFVQQFVTNTAGDENSLTLLQGGGSLGARIIRNKMFFFVSAEGQLLNASEESHFAVPTVEQRGFLRSGAEGLSATGTQQSFPTTVVGDYIFSLFPFPNDPSGVYGRNTYTQVLPANARGRIVSGRYDYNLKIREKAQAFTSRYNYTDDKRDLQSVGGALFSGVRPLTRTDNLSSFLSGEITDNLSNVLRVSFGRTRLEFEEIRDATGFVLPVARQFNNRDDARFLLNARAIVNFTFPGDSIVRYIAAPIPFETILGPVGQVNLSGFSPVGVDVFNFPQRRVNNTFQIADTLFLRSGRHNFAFGADVRRTSLDSDLPRNSRTSINFTGAFRAANYTGPLSIPNLLTPGDLAASGAATGLFQSLVLPNSDSTIELTFNQLNFFVQDDFQFKPNLTMSFGLRYEFNTVPQESDDKIENSFRQPLPAAVSGLGRFINGRTKIYDADQNNFAPRFGFAYSPSRSTVIRGGYGLYYDQIIGAVVSQSRNVFPTFTTVNFGGVPAGSAPNPILGFSPYNLTIGGQPIIQPGTLNTLNPNLTQQQLINFVTARFPTPFGATIPQIELKTPFAHHYFIGAEQEIFSKTILSLGYVGTAGRDLLRFSTPNLGRYNIISISNLQLNGSEPNIFGSSSSPFGSNREPLRPVSNIGPIDQFETSGRSRYDALQLQLRGRMNPFDQGIQYQLSYTYSKVKDDVSDVFDLAGAPALPQNSVNFAGEYAPANFDIRHRITYNFIYDLPQFEKQTSTVRFLLSGWQLIGSGRFHTGQPFTVNTIYDVNQDGNSTDRLNNTQFIAQGNSRRQPLILTSTSDAALLGMLAPVGQDGAVPRNSFRAGKVLELDMSVNKRFAFTERQSLLFRVDVFNFINRANFGVPVRFLESPSFGQAVETITPARRIQFALKYIF